MEALSYNRPPMAGGPTIYDIAARAGVGIATVSRVLNASDRVAEPTRQAVLRAVGDLGFRANRAARRLATRGPDRPRVAALMPFSSANFYFSVSRPLSQGLALADIDLALHDVRTREDKQRILDRLLAERSCEGVVLCSMGIGDERRAHFRRLGVPLISVDYPLPDLPCCTVDNVAGGTLAVRRLLDAGSRRVGLITGPLAALAFRDRERGFSAVAGGDAPIVRARTVSREEGRAATAALLERHGDLDGVVCVNDVLAVGALEELRRLGRGVPDEVQVIGFDDLPLIDVIGLSTIHQPMARFGEWAAETIAALMTRPGAAAPPSVVLPLTLASRATTRAVLADAPPDHDRPQNGHRRAQPRKAERRSR